MVSAHVTTSLFSGILSRHSPIAGSPLPAFLRLPRQISLPLAVTLPTLTHFSLPNLLNDIWTGILNAVPKKKTSYMKKRSRFLAGKALKDVTALNHCSACGHLKRAHVLCPYCVAEIKNMFNGKMKDAPKPDDA